MDKPRANPKKKRGPLYIGGAVVGVVAVTVGLSQLEPAPPSVDRAQLYMDTVQMGTFVKNVRGNGTLVPENIRLITAVVTGRVEQVYELPGAQVQPGTPLVRLSNPDVDNAHLEALNQLSQARSQLVQLEANLQTSRLQQVANIATVERQYNDAVRQDESNKELLARGLIAENIAKLAADTRAELQQRLQAERQRLELMEQTSEPQLAAAQAQVDQLTRIVDFRQGQVNSMLVTSPATGVLTSLDLDVGAFVTAGTELARVVESPPRLKAELRIQEAQVRDVVLGQRAMIELRPDTVWGTVSRIDPASQTGTVGVDVAFTDKLPASARPSQTVDGYIEITKMDNVLFVARPSYGGANNTISLFVVDADGKGARRVQVRLGEASVSEVQILDGLKEGDIVILSGTDQVDEHDRIRINN